MNKPNGERKKIASVILDIYNDNSTVMSPAQNINPEFIRIKLIEHAMLLGDQIAIGKMKFEMNQKKIQLATSIPNLKLNKIQW